MENQTTLETAKKLGLLESEFDTIKTILNRVPNFTELSIYSVMWSEHCSYKNSIKWLKTLPKEGSRILAKAGEENAGLVDIGEGLACAFKIESHNHPSAVEPYQGAATGVGGINRDIFTMGARPIAQLNSLRFGNLDKEKNKWLLRGVVKGIGDYGNAFGIPTVGGEVFFDDCFNQNPLVNAMSVGIVKVGETISATSYGSGNLVFIVGSSTGKDGIHGATFASADITENSAEDLPAVQVGDPFQEKLLLEATLEVIKTGSVVGMQDMGAAGIICSTSEMSAKGKHGMNINLDLVPTRQKDMKPFEILLSESQERMLIVVEKGKEDLVKNVFDKWDLNCKQIGEVIEGDFLNFFSNGELVANVPANSLVLGGGAPVYEREYSEPEYFTKNQKFDINEIPIPNDLIDVAKNIISSLNISSKKWISNQYDSMVGTANMSSNNPSDAAIVNLKGTNRALALSVDCNSRYVFSNPEVGCAIAVAEAARNIVCSGGQPLAVTNCLNFGNPYNPEVYWQFVGAIKGMSYACRALETPVTGGNVSFYNQYTEAGETKPVFPTPTIGMLGLIEDKSNIIPMGYQNKDEKIFVLGELKDEINSSEYLYNFHNIKNSPAPYFTIENEIELHKLIKNLNTKKLISACHDVSDGGLFTTLCEMAFINNIGFAINSVKTIRIDSFLFGESQSRAVVSIDASKENEFLTVISESKISHQYLGKTNENNSIIIDEINFGNVVNYLELYSQKIPNLMDA
ncbi:MAG: phosphoribosylformylglycinamidine synthase subunit PurL [Bacteroidota bacterium]